MRCVGQFALASNALQASISRLRRKTRSFSTGCHVRPSIWEPTHLDSVVPHGRPNPRAPLELWQWNSEVLDARRRLLTGRYRTERSRRAALRRYLRALAAPLTAEEAALAEQLRAEDDRREIDRLACDIAAGCLRQRADPAWVYELNAREADALVERLGRSATAEERRDLVASVRNRLEGSA